MFGWTRKGNAVGAAGVEAAARKRSQNDAIVGKTLDVGHDRKKVF